MLIDIQARGFPLTKALRAYINRRTDFALRTRDHRIQHIMVRLSDTNGPRGGIDKCCRIQVEITQLPDVVVEDTEANLYVAIDRAVDKASRTVGRRLTRQRDRVRAPASILWNQVSGLETAN